MALNQEVLLIRARKVLRKQLDISVICCVCLTVNYEASASLSN